MRNVGRAIIAAGLALAGPMTPALAQSKPEREPESEQYRGENGGGGKAVDLTFNYASDLNADVSGGQSRGVDYLGRASVLLDADLDKLVGLSGATAHVSFYDIHGVGLSGSRVGNLLTVSGIEAEPAFRLNQIWVEVAPSAATSVRVGKFTAAQEFMVSRTANLFVNSTFGWPDSFATDLPGGGPAYPLAGPGVRLAVKPDSRITVRVAVFAGDPAGAGRGDPQQRDKHGFNSFDLAGRPFVIAQVARTSGGQHPTSTVAVGGWVHLDRFADLNDPAVTPGPVAGPGGVRGDIGVYGLAETRVWRSARDGKRAASVFARASYSPSRLNVIDLYADGGVSLSAPFRGRDKDKVGVAVAIARISPDLRRTARALAASGAPATVPPAFEGVVEATYQASVVGPLMLQPNVQYVVHPASSALAIQVPGGRIPDAVVVGLRTSVSF